MARGRKPKEKLPILWQAPEVEKMGREIIAANHQHLAGRPITFAFAPKSLKVHGKPASGRAEIWSGESIPRTPSTASTPSSGR